MSRAGKRIWSILGNAQRLDGGAMFGNAPRALWERWIRPDEQNLIPLATRAMLIREEGGRLLLFEAGIGAFFEPRLRRRYGVEEENHVLLASLAAAGFAPADIEVVVLSHLHFDHAGGLLEAWREGAAPALCFPRATFVLSRAAWERARKPHVRDRASFIPELPSLIEESGRLEIVEGERSETLGGGYRFHFSNGHTPGLMLTEVNGPGGPVVFAGDLVPARPWLHLPITMGYDRYPELLIDEKTALLNDLHERGGRLFLTHDSEAAMVRPTRDEQGRFGAGETWRDLAGAPL
jgi:glyoxylase-like metal-dependent hydrolase (beta-lactamase superfamily II)